MRSPIDREDVDVLVVWGVRAVAAIAVIMAGGLALGTAVRVFQWAAGN